MLLEMMGCVLLERCEAMTDVLLDISKIDAPTFIIKKWFII